MLTVLSILLGTHLTRPEQSQYRCRRLSQHPWPRTRSRQGSALSPTAPATRLCRQNFESAWKGPLRLGRRVFASADLDPLVCARLRSSRLVPGEHSALHSAPETGRAMRVPGMATWLVLRSIGTAERRYSWQTTHVTGSGRLFQENAIQIRLQMLQGCRLRQIAHDPSSNSSWWVKISGAVSRRKTVMFQASCWGEEIARKEQKACVGRAYRVPRSFWALPGVKSTTRRTAQEPHCVPRVSEYSLRPYTPHKNRYVPLYTSRRSQPPTTPIDIFPFQAQGIWIYDRSDTGC